MSAFARGALVVAALAIGAHGVVVGCSSKEDPPPTSPGPGAKLEKFSPSGCGYSVARTQIDGYPLFEPHVDEASADPKIRFVRRGLGGDVKAGSAGYADPSTSFVVSWQTDAATKATRIRYGESPDKLDKVVDGVSLRLEEDKNDVRFHEVHVCGLQPGRTYHYQVGGGAPGKEVWSPVFSTTTAPPAGAETVKIGLVGDTRDDLGRSDLPIWRNLANRFKAGGVPIVLFSGDMILIGLDQKMWDSWSKAGEAASPSVFFALAPGNHENEQIRYFAHSVMPAADSKNAERYASFDYGPVHVVMIDDYPGIVAPSIDDTDYRAEVLAWLDADLAKANANRAKVPWIVTYHHHPMYSDTTNSSRAKETEHMRSALLAMFDKHGVDLDVAGHDHFYERFKPLKSGAPDAKGTTYVICAAAGAPAYNIKAETPLAAKAQEYDPEKGQGYYGIATVNATSFKVKVHSLSPSGTSPNDDPPIDEFELTKR